MSRYNTLDHGGGKWISRSSAAIHLCAPPKAYPDQLMVTPGTSWRCATCKRAWVSVGIQFLNDRYPVSPAGNDRLIGPMRWRLATNEVEAFPGEQDLYDWRPAVLILLPELRRLIELIEESLT